MAHNAQPTQRCRIRFLQLPGSWCLLGDVGNATAMVLSVLTYIGEQLRRGMNPPEFNSPEQKEYPGPLISWCGCKRGTTKSSMKCEGDYKSGPNGREAFCIQIIGCRNRCCCPQAWSRREGSPKGGRSAAKNSPEWDAIGEKLLPVTTPSTYCE